MSKARLTMGELKIKTTAFWAISLDCECPNCNQPIDLVDDADFRLGSVKPLETDTPATNNLEVKCQNCDFEFLVKLAY